MASSENEKDEFSLYILYEPAAGEFNRPQTILSLSVAVSTVTIQIGSSWLLVQNTVTVTESVNVPQVVVAVKV